VILDISGAIGHVRGNFVHWCGMSRQTHRYYGTHHAFLITTPEARVPAPKSKAHERQANQQKFNKFLEGY
jgi:hypothetical protein